MGNIFRGRRKLSSFPVKDDFYPAISTKGRAANGGKPDRPERLRRTSEEISVGVRRLDRNTTPSSSMGRAGRETTVPSDTTFVSDLGPHGPARQDFLLKRPEVTQQVAHYWQASGATSP
jgi:hypothetical protein